MSPYRPLDRKARPKGIECPLCLESVRDACQCSRQPTQRIQGDSMTIDTDPFAEVPRDHYGRPLIIPADGGKPKAYTRCTTYVGCLEDTYNLAKWQQRMVATGLAARPDLLLSVSAHSDDKKQLDRLCADALEAAKGSAAATTGTALHRLTERVDRGEDVAIPDAAKADVAAYVQATGHFAKQHIEVLTVHDELKVAGTPDRVLIVDGQPVIADLKTGSIDFGIGKIAMQLALYSRSSLYNLTTGARSALEVNQDRALVIHLPAGTGECHLVWVDIAAGWEAVGLAGQVRAWRSRKNLATPYVADDWLAALIDVAGDTDSLTGLWRDHQAQWQPHHTALAAARKQALTALPVAS